MIHGFRGRARGGGEDLETLQVLLGVLLFRAVIGLGALSAVGWRISKIRDKIRFWCCVKRAETEIPRTQWPIHGCGGFAVRPLPVRRQCALGHVRGIVAPLLHELSLEPLRLASVDEPIFLHSANEHQPRAQFACDHGDHGDDDSKKTRRNVCNLVSTIQHTLLHAATRKHAHNHGHTSEGRLCVSYACAHCISRYVRQPCRSPSPPVDTPSSDCSACDNCTKRSSLASFRVSFALSSCTALNSTYLRHDSVTCP